MKKINFWPKMASNIFGESLYTAWVFGLLRFGSGSDAGFALGGRFQNPKPFTPKP